MTNEKTALRGRINPKLATEPIIGKCLDNNSDPFYYKNKNLS